MPAPIFLERMFLLFFRPKRFARIRAAGELLNRTSFNGTVSYFTVALAILLVTRVLRFSAVRATPLIVQFSNVIAALGSISKPSQKSQFTNLATL